MTHHPRYHGSDEHARYPSHHGTDEDTGHARLTARQRQVRVLVIAIVIALVLAILIMHETGAMPKTGF